ncbi:porin [Rhizobium sp. ARZ01]|uniref:porin n=1 Tax=Rhizobium sp. ARZ01 TaxID=2769313 RepID=UPI001780F9C7|nr:porin [Rhizobium sp. ARZ01]MBD9375410.1 porin [Rhizobium sp. ARZ01]
MNIKRFLLSAATTFVALNDTCAADSSILISEPETSGYLRVCDTYGTGYFYIPGTETCLKLEGYVWGQVGADSYSGPGSSPDYLTYGSFPGDQTHMSTSVRLQLDARSETELGTLHGRMRVVADIPSIDPASGSDINLEQGFVDLGGFRIGYLETAWVDTKNGGVSSWGSHSWGGLSYGYFFRNLISYSIGSDESFAATLSLEDGDSSNYVPDAVGLLSYNQAWGGVWAKFGFDEDYDYDGASGWGASAGLQLNTPGGNGSLRLITYYSDADVVYGVGAPYLAITGGNGAAEWSVLASYYHQFTPIFGASLGGQYFSDFYEGLSDRKTGVSAYEAEISLVLTPVNNLEIRSEIYYDKVEDLDGTVSGFLRLTSFF